MNTNFKKEIDTSISTLFPNRYTFHPLLKYIIKVREFINFLGRRSSFFEENSEKEASRENINGIQGGFGKSVRDRWTERQRKGVG